MLPSERRRLFHADMQTFEGTQNDVIVIQNNALFAAAANPVARSSGLKRSAPAKGHRHADSE